MRKLTTTFAAVSILAGIAAANAQTPGAGAPGQDQRPADQQAQPKMPGAPAAKDAPPSSGAMGTTGAGPYERPSPASPAVRNDPSIHQSTGDRDSRGTPK